MRVARCDVTARREERGARISGSGLDDFSMQRLRNIFQLYPLAEAAGEVERRLVLDDIDDG